MKIYFCVLIDKFQEKFLFRGQTTLTLRTGFVILLATQLTFRGDYEWPTDYLTRTLPIIFYGSFLGVPTFPADSDNACMRQKYNKRNENSKFFCLK